MQGLIRSVRNTLLTAALLAGAPAYAGNQLEEQMSSSVRAALHKAVADQSAPFLAFASNTDARAWIDAMSGKLAQRMPDRALREDFLITIHYEAKRAGLDPQLVLGLIQVESAFRKYAISSAGARGLMQVMPFWLKAIGSDESNLFHLRTNLRFGCVILRHYIDMERGDLFRALGRYNGSLGRAEYPNLVLAAWRQWDFNPAQGGVVKTSAEASPALRPVTR